MTPPQRGEPPPQLVRYHDWRQVDLPPPEEFRPELPVSVIIPYYDQLEELERTLAALEGQTWPRHLFEVVVVDDGSPEPLAEVGATLLREAPFPVRTFRQEDLGFGAGRARNRGVREAAHEILLFLDADMLPEADWLSAHARWHHALPDALTLGLRAHVPVDGLDAAAIRQRPGTLKELLADRPVDLVERWWSRSVWKNPDDSFRVVLTASLGVRRRFFDLVGGFDEAFIRWGGEDTEFGYRAFTRGGLLVPMRDGFAWHQGPWEDGRATKVRELESALAQMSHLVAHPRVRKNVPGRSFTVPQFVVTIPGEARPAKELKEAIERLLADPLHDLVIRLELSEDHPDREWLTYQFGPDPRVRVAPPGTALPDFPNSPFHVTLSAGIPLRRNFVERLRAALGTAVLGRCVFPDGAHVSIVRSWALHRAIRTPWEPTDFGEVATIPPRRLRPPPRVEALRVWGRFLVELRRVRGPHGAWRFVRWLAGAVPRWFRGARPAHPSRANRPPGPRIALLGARSRAVLAASAEPAGAAAGDPVDLVLADTAEEAAGVKGSVILLEQARPLLSVPAFDPLEHNPIGWERRVEGTIGALGSLDRLPAGVRANCVVSEADEDRIALLHHMEDVRAFHAGPVARAASLARLAARGVFVHLADSAPELEGLLGEELYRLLAGAAPGSDENAREAISIRIRRAALREHSLGARTRQLFAAAGVEGPSLPLVSVLLVTRRPELLEHALGGVARQTWPRIHLVLGLHGHGFGEVENRLPKSPLAATVVRIAAEENLGAALNRLAAAARGSLLAKMDDDDAYGREHLWDLVLAREYSRADLVTKTPEFVYLAKSHLTIQGPQGVSERRSAMGAGGTMLLSREVLDRVGGFPRVPREVEASLSERVRERGGEAYRTHGAGFVLVCRDGDAVSKAKDEQWFLDRAFRVWPGWDPEGTRIGDMSRSWAPGFAEESD